MRPEKPERCAEARFPEHLHGVTSSALNIRSNSPAKEKAAGPVPSSAAGQGSGDRCLEHQTFYSIRVEIEGPPASTTFPSRARHLEELAVALRAARAFLEFHQLPRHSMHDCASGPPEL
jgi:hypothetical protein